MYFELPQITQLLAAPAQLRVHIIPELDCAHPSHTGLTLSCNQAITQTLIYSPLPLHTPSKTGERILTAKN